METLELRRKANLLLAESSRVSERCREEKSAVIEAKAKRNDCAEAQALVQAVSEKVQNEAHSRIAGVVTSCLRSVFGDGSEFRIVFARKRGKTEAKMVFLNGGKEESPLEASSGGKLEVAAFALRLVCVLLSRPAKRRLLVLDEPFKSVHGEEYRERTRELVEEMAKKMGFQIIFASGLGWLKCGKIVDVSKGETK